MLASLKSRKKALDAQHKETMSPRAANAPTTPPHEGALSAGGAQQGGAPAAEPAAEQSSAPTAHGGGSRFLVITVHEARNLVACDYASHSSDPYVKVSLGGTSRKTRAIYHNCHPLWEQKLLFPVDGLSEGEPLLVELYDRNLHSKIFLGQVVMTLGKALHIAGGDMAPRDFYWLSLCKKRSTDIVGGELCLGFATAAMEPAQHAQLLADLEGQLDADSLAATYASKALHVQLKGLNGLAASGLFGGGGGSSSAKAGQQQQQQGLTLYVKWGRVTVEKPLPPLPRPAAAPAAAAEDGTPCEGSAAMLPFDCELAVNEEVIIPLAAAVRPTPLVARKRDELYLKSQDTLIAKTQIPIAALPDVSSPRTTAGSPAPAMAAYSGDVLGCGPEGLAAGLIGAEADSKCSRRCSASMPAMPRGTGSDFTIGASYVPEGPPSSKLGIATPPMSRSHSDAAAAAAAMAAVNKRLAALAGLASTHSAAAGGIGTTALSTCSSLNASSAGGAAPAGGSGALTPHRLLVEGSLDSVTACARGQVQSPAGLNRRRVQGLAELHDSAGARMKPLRAMFMPPREVSRMGWAPTRVTPDEACPAATDAGTCGGAPCSGGSNTSSASASASASCARPLCRIMESTVPMHCNLEVVLCLSVVSAPAPAQQDAPAAGLLPSGGGAAGAGAAAAAASSDDGGGSDAFAADEPQPDDGGPTLPLQLPAPYEVLLQDVTLEGISAGRLHALLLGGSSQLMAEHYACMELSEVVVGPWRPAPEGCAWRRVRSVTYTKRLKIPVPLAPEKCHVWEEHRLLARTSGGWVAQVVCTSDAPKGDCFEAHVQLCGVHVTSTSCRLRISMQLNWHKQTWGKGMVQAGAEADAKKGWQACVAALKQHAGQCSAAAGCPASRGQDGGAFAQQGAAASADAATATSAPSRGRWPPGWRLAAVKGGGGAWVRTCVQLALALALLVLAWAVWAGARSINLELRQLTAAVQACQASNDAAGSIPGAGVAGGMLQ